MLGGVLLWRLQSADTYAHTTYRSPDHLSTLAPGALPLAVVNNAVTILSGQIPVPVSAFTFFFFDIYSKVELLDHMVILRLIFFEESHPFLQQLYHFTSPLATHKGSNSSVSLTKKNNNV